jgi:hypothetical protein
MKETASAAIAIGAVRIWTRTPPRAKPVNSATEPLAESALLAATSRLRATIDGRYALLAASK